MKDASLQVEKAPVVGKIRPTQIVSQVATESEEVGLMNALSPCLYGDEFLKRKRK